MQDELIGVNYAKEIRGSNKRIGDLELLMYGDEKKGIHGIAKEVDRFRRYFYYVAGAWFIIGSVWTIIGITK